MAAFCYRRDVARFDRWASKYERSWTQRLFFRPVHQRVAELATGMAPSPRRVLDVGCGTGALLRILAGHLPDADLVGADASAEMIRMAETSNPFPEKLRFVRAAAEQLPFTDRHFDLVLSTISFHHWADQAKGLGEIARGLVSGGAFILADHFVISPQQVFYASPGRRKRFHTPKEIGEMFDEAGLTQPEWHDIYRFGPLLIIAGVTARKA